MSLRPIAALAALLFASAALAEEPNPHAGHGAMAPAEAMPAACGAPAPAPSMPMDASAMDAKELTPVQAGNTDAMAAMHGPMMQAAMIEDADLAFNCGMIAHHRGAIAMAKVELEHGKDAASRALATRIIAAQEAEIAEMTAFVEARAK